MKLVLASCLLVSMVLSPNAFAQRGSKKTVQKNPPGVAVGKKAPDFELKDQRGRPQKLSEMLKKGPVAVVFHRSADW